MCRDTGWVEVEIEGVKRMQHCSCYEITRMQKAWERAGISDAFKEMTFDCFKNWDARVNQAYKTAHGYAANFESIENTRQNSLTLLGEVGSGKTSLGICVLNELFKKAVSVLYAPYRDIVSELKGNVLDDDAYRRALEKYLKPRVLFIDDLYKGHTQNDPKYVYDIVNARYLAKKPMIVTSERSADELLDIDEAVGSRIIEMSRGYIYELKGNGLNYRLRGL